MNEPNAERALVALLKEICSSREIRITSFSDNWIFCLQKGERTSYVFGYDFNLNNATAKIICKDKSATSDLLAFHNLPHVEHRLFYHPQLAGYIPLRGNWPQMLSYFESCARDVVCKPNEGTGGRDVYRVRNELELEAAALHIFATNLTLSLSPFQAIGAEYRVGVLHDTIQFLYRKHRPVLVGDGTQSIRQLVISRLNGAENFTGEVNTLKGLAEMQVDFGYVPAKGEHVPLNWRHNLGQGASPELMDPQTVEARRICRLALQATNAIDVALASVDIVDTAEGLRVLEINSGIMMESLVRRLPEGRTLARRFYDQIVCEALGIEQGT